MEFTNISKFEAVKQSWIKLESNLTGTDQIVAERTLITYGASTSLAESDELLFHSILQF